MVSSPQKSVLTQYVGSQRFFGSIRLATLMAYEISVVPVDDGHVSDQNLTAGEKSMANTALDSVTLEIVEVRHMVG